MSRSRRVVVARGREKVKNGFSSRVPRHTRAVHVEQKYTRSVYTGVEFSTLPRRTYCDSRVAYYSYIYYIRGDGGHRYADNRLRSLDRFEPYVVCMYMRTTLYRQDINAGGEKRASRKDVSRMLSIRFFSSIEANAFFSFHHLFFFTIRQ